MSSIWTLRRSAADAKLAGLCAGLAARWRVDPVVVRVGFAVLALSGGVGVVLYLAGWLLLPVTGRDTAPVDDLLGEQTRKWPKEVWLAVVVFACLIMFGIFGSVTPFGFGPAIILAVVWYFGFYRTRAERPGSSAPAPPEVPPSTSEPVTPFTVAGEAWRQRVEEHARAGHEAGHEGGQVERAAGAPITEGRAGASALDLAFWAHPDPVGLYAEPAPVAPAPVASGALSRRTSLAARRLRLVGLVILGLVLAGLGVADRLGAAVPVTAYLAAALGVVGLTLLAATWFGRARGILPIGLLLALSVVAATAAEPVASRYDWRSAERAYATASELPAASDRLEAGRLQIDLTAMPVVHNLTYAAHVDVGSLEVTVPRDVAVRINYRVESGMMVAYNEPVDTGTGLGDVIEPRDLRPGAPVLTLDLSVDRGRLQVSR